MPKFTVFVKQQVKGPGGPIISGEKCASNVLYAIPWGYGREIVNGSEV